MTPLAVFVCKADSRLMRLLDVILTPVLGRGKFLSSWVTTIRWPGAKEAIIYYPRGADMTWGDWPLVVDHEWVHVRDWFEHPWLMYVWFALPFWGRWRIERQAYLGDIRAGRFTPSQAADIIRRNYLEPWPKSAMVVWFTLKLGESK